MSEKVCPLMGIRFDCRWCHLYIEFDDEYRCVFEVIAILLESMSNALGQMHLELERLNAKISNLINILEEGDG